MVALSVLVSGLDAELMRLGYKDLPEWNQDLGLLDWLTSLDPSPRIMRSARPLAVP